MGWEFYHNEKRPSRSYWYYEIDGDLEIRMHDATTEELESYKFGLHFTTAMNFIHFGNINSCSVDKAQKYILEYFVILEQKLSKLK